MGKCFLSVFFILSLAACAGKDIEYTYPEKVNGRYQRNPKKQETIFDEGGIGKKIFAFARKEAEEESSTKNLDLWKASIETLRFMPFISVDSRAGVLITDWYSPASLPNERVKVTVMVTSATLRADGVSVLIIKQEKNDKGDWVDVKTSKETALKLEKAILSKAREGRAATSEINE